jgi:hypothetical protein
VRGLPVSPVEEIERAPHGVVGTGHGPMLL